jgi:hypothetical protein
MERTMNSSCKSLVFPPLLLGLATLAFGCGGTGGEPLIDANANAPDADPNAPDAAPPPPGFELLLARDWTIPAGSEIYRCTRLTVPRDMYVTGFHSLSPQGTHHTVLSVDDNPSAPDGDYNCSAGNIAHTMLFASGVGTDDLLLPQGVAVRLQAGQQLELNLHLFNVSDAAIAGTSGTMVSEVAAGEVTDLAEVVFGGSYNIFLPSDPGTEQTVNGGCNFQQDATVFALWPHMHQLGRHVVVRHMGNAGTTTLLDSPFAFGEQINYPIPPVSVNAGDRLDIDCVYINDTGSAVTFGDSSTQEMCFVGIYRYPATNTGTFGCVGG